MPPITRGLFRARKIWIDDALGSAARCRRVALRQRRVAALVIVAPPVVHMQANRISRIVRLSASRRRRQNRRERQNRQSRNAHRSSSVPAPAGSSDRKQTGPFVPGQFTFARWGRAPYRFGRRDVRHVQEHLRGQCKSNTSPQDTLQLPTDLAPDLVRFQMSCSSSGVNTHGSLSIRT